MCQKNKGEGRRGWEYYQAKQAGSATRRLLRFLKGLWLELITDPLALVLKEEGKDEKR